MSLFPEILPVLKSFTYIFFVGGTCLHILSIPMMGYTYTFIIDM